MRFYTLSAGYIQYLQSLDPKVPNHSGAGYVNEKPYIGVVLNIEGCDFLAPMSSPKGWHQGVKNSDNKYFKLHHVGDPTQSLGIINIRYMIPVLAGAYELIDFTQCDPKYVTLLQAQFDFIKPNRGTITKKANKVFDLVVNKKLPYMVSQCCDFPKLLDEHKKYNV